MHEARKIYSLYQSRQGSHEEHLQTQRHREAEEGKLDPLGEPGGGKAVVEDDDIFHPHFPDGQAEDRVAKAAEFHGDGVDGHAEYHAEDHRCGENDTLKLCFWHIIFSFSLETEKRHKICRSHQTGGCDDI